MRDTFTQLTLIITYPSLVYLIHRYRSSTTGLIGTTAKVLKDLAVALDAHELVFLFIEWMPALIFSSVICLFLGAFIFGREDQSEEPRV